MDSRDTFACHLGCIDGRVHEGIVRYIRRKYKVKRVDQVTKRGMVRVLAENADDVVIGDIKEDVSISVNGHYSRVIAISAHPDCGGNRVSDEQQMEQLSRAYETVKTFGFHNVKIILLWLEEDWVTVREISYKPLAKDCQGDMALLSA